MKQQRKSRTKSKRQANFTAISEYTEDLEIQIFKPDSPEMKAAKSLDIVKVRELGKKLRIKAEEYRANNMETAMIFMDDEADSVYLLAIALGDNDTRIIAREFASMMEETQDLLFRECVS